MADSKENYQWDLGSEKVSVPISSKETLWVAIWLEETRIVKRKNVKGRLFTRCLAETMVFAQSIGLWFSYEWID